MLEVGASSCFWIENVKVDTMQDTLEVRNSVVTIEPRLMRIIVKLAQNAGNVVPREVLLNEISEQAYVSDESLTQAVSKIRIALEDSSKPPRFIKTVPKKGYILIVPVKICREDDTGAERNTVLSAEERSPLVTNKWLMGIALLIVVVGVSIVIDQFKGENTQFIEKRETEFIEKDK